MGCVSVLWVWVWDLKFNPKTQNPTLTYVYTVNRQTNRDRLRDARANLLRQYSTTLYFIAILCINGGKHTLSAPPGIEIVFYAILAGCFLAAAAIAYYIGHLISRLLKVRVRATEIIVIAVLFLLSFWASSLMLQQREDNQTIYFYGNPTPYHGAWLYYGFPTIWYRMFEPYDITQKHLFTTPSITNFANFFINLAFWMTIPVTLVYFGKFLLARAETKNEI